ncbi:MAG: glutaminase domain-containing protein, partial [Methanococcaceae archaeon]
MSKPNFLFLTKSLLSLIVLLMLTGRLSAQTPSFRPPATPLVTSDTYFSIWSESDHPADDWTKHWTGRRHAIISMVRLDGQAYRLLGREPWDLKPFPLAGQRVTPTQTIYDFSDGKIKLSLTFTSPLLPNDLSIYSLPITYITWKAEAVDGKTHKVEIYFDNSAEIAVNNSDQQVNWSRSKLDNLEVLSVGSKDQNILSRSGDDLRIDWGYLYLVSPDRSRTKSSIQKAGRTWDTFIKEGKLPSSDDLQMPRASNQGAPVLAFSYDFGQLGTTPAEAFLVMAYDDQYSIEFFHRRLQPYWRMEFAGAEDMLKKAVSDYKTIVQKCNDFDNELMADLSRTGGEDYARMCALSYRQSMAANKLAADIDGTPLLFPKENFSNGCISTVDVIYPASPLLMLFNTTLLKASLEPVMQYAAMKRWKFDFAPHDIGQYPLANGQVYGGGETSAVNQMPVEESGNMMLMMYAIAYSEKSADFSLKYWPQLEKWAKYLMEKGFDPENQLCTDDFAGHLAHNVNLSLKSILALGAYSKLCTMAGKKDQAKVFWQAASASAKKWEQMGDDGDHYRLAYDKPGTWSQKYNLLWDKLLDINLFPDRVAEKEIKYYKSKLNAYGLPLDNRADYTKLDWSVWTATLAENKADFEAIFSKTYDFINKTNERVPLTDWYSTIDAKKIGFQARS